MASKDSNLKFSTGKKVNNVSVNKNWLMKIENFIKEAKYDPTKYSYYMFEKDMKRL